MCIWRFSSTDRNRNDINFLSDISVDTDDPVTHEGQSSVLGSSDIPSDIGNGDSSDKNEDYSTDCLIDYGSDSDNILYKCR